VQSHVGGRFSSTGSLTSATPGSLYCCSRERHKDLIARCDWTRGPQYEIVSAFRFCLLEMHFILSAANRFDPSKVYPNFSSLSKKRKRGIPTRVLTITNSPGRKAIKPQREEMQFNFYYKNGKEGKNLFSRSKIKQYSVNSITFQLSSVY